jgi:hypothetical protein
VEPAAEEKAPAEEKATEPVAEKDEAAKEGGES